jgi:hypothetical protein
VVPIGVSIGVQCQTENQDALIQAVSRPGVPALVSMVIEPEGITRVGFAYSYDPANENLDHNDCGPARCFSDTGVPVALWMGSQNPDVGDVVTIGELPSGFLRWTPITEARESGARVAEFAAEWAAYLEANNCTYLDGC